MQPQLVIEFLRTLLGEKQARTVQLVLVAKSPRLIKQPLSSSEQSAREE